MGEDSPCAVYPYLGNIKAIIWVPGDYSCAIHGPQMSTFPEQEVNHLRKDPGLGLGLGLWRCQGKNISVISLQAPAVADTS